MRNCPNCSLQMQQDEDADDYPSSIYICPNCGHTETNLEADDFDPGEELND